MEEHQLPVHTEPVIVASNKKHSWSKKEKLALYVAGVFALVGIGFGGYTFYNDVILNAAGEASLGSDVTVDLPLANESPYFKISNTSQQILEVQYTGEALASDGNLAPNWRLEQSSNPSDDTTWKVASNDIYSYTEGSGVVHRYVGASDRNVSVGYSTNPDTLQPDSDYYFRASKASDVKDQFGNVTGQTWTPQGNMVMVHTEAYPTLQATGNGDQVKLSWSNVTANKDVSSSWTGGPVRSYVILRSTNPASFADAKTSWIQASSGNKDFTTVGEANIALLLLEQDQSTGVFNKTEAVIQQPKNTTYYYALAAMEYFESQGTKSVALIHRVLGSPQMVVSNAATGNLLSDISMNPASLTPVRSADKSMHSMFITNTDVNVTLKTNLTPGDQWLTQTRLVYGAGGYDNSVTCFAGKSSSGWLPYDSSKKTVALSLKTCVSPTVKKVGADPKFRLETDVWTNPNSSPSIHTTYSTPVTVQQVDAPLTAKYSDASISRNKKTTVTVSGFCNSSSSSCRFITGDLQLVNLTTNKVIKSVSIQKSIKFSGNSATVKFTFSSKYKGNFKLGVKYVNSPDGLYFYKDTVIKLPTLKVK